MCVSLAKVKQGENELCRCKYMNIRNINDVLKHKACYVEQHDKIKVRALTMLLTKRKIMVKYTKLWKIS